MPRRGIIKKKKLPGDQKYNSTLITKFINTYMKEGKRSTAERAIYATLDAIQQKTKEDPLKVFEKAVDNVRPVLETKSRRVGGATYQVPIEVESGRSIAVGVRWLIHYAEERGGRSMVEKLSSEKRTALSPITGGDLIDGRLPDFRSRDHFEHDGATA
jgi:small subunit ribosomal protein S7